MPDSSGFGDYIESGIVIPCLLDGQEMNFIARIYLDDESPIAGGQEIWGFPKKSADPTLAVFHDTLTGTLSNAGQQVALGTMAYKHVNLLARELDLAHVATKKQDAIRYKMTKTHVNLKLIPHVDGNLAISQLVAFNLEEITVKGAWASPARLHLVPHVNAPVADQPVRNVHDGLHLIADLTLPYGRGVHDYITQKGA